MAIPSRKSDPVGLLIRRVALLVLLLFVIAALSALWDVYKKERDSRVLRVQAETQLQNLVQQEERLTNEIARLETSRGQEEMLRENYEMAKEGERVIIIIEPPKPEPLPATTTSMQKWMHRLIPFY
jgi:cell division protein FtsB